MVYRVYKNGFGKKEKAAVAVFAAVTIIASNAAGYVLNVHNNTKAMSDDTMQVTKISAGKTSALVPMYGQYCDNALSVLDCSLRDDQYCIYLKDLCESMGDYGALNPTTPPKYWVENPVNEIPVCGQYLFNGEILNRSVLAKGATLLVSDNGYYVQLTPSDDGKLFHSVLNDTDYNGALTNYATLWVFDETLLSQDKITVYFKLSAPNPAKIDISTEYEGFYYDVDSDDEWIYAELSTNGSKALKVYLSCEST
jgi:hypothetical protein